LRAGALNELILKSKALSFRRENGLGDSDPIKLKSLLIKLQVNTFFRPLSETFSGMALKIDGNRFMLINSSHPIGRQNFSICHELYHLFIQEKFDTLLCATGNFDKKGKEEYSADIFSSSLLLPDAGIIDRLPDIEKLKNNIKLPTLIEIEQSFGCSRAAVLVKLKSLGIIDNSKIEEFRTGVIHKARNLGYPIELYLPGRNDLNIGDYGKKASCMFERELISESNFASMMHDIGIDIYAEDNYGSY
jgi:Zn-dependent peptidase ImmA (M78 family)